MQTLHRVLIVGETRESREFATVVLERAGFGVTGAATGAEALQLARTTGPDVVVLDAQLPDLDGFEASRRLEAEPSIARISAGEDVIEAELIGRRRDGSLVPVAMSVRRIVDPDGPIHEGILVDLTDRKRAEEATALRSVTELANAAAHEINNPLTIIVGQLELLHDGTNVAERIEWARAAVTRISDIVNHMVRITRLEPSTGGPPGLPRMLDIRRSGPPGP